MYLLVQDSFGDGDNFGDGKGGGKLIVYSTATNIITFGDGNGDGNGDGGSDNRTLLTENHLLYLTAMQKLCS